MISNPQLESQATWIYTLYLGPVVIDMMRLQEPQLRFQCLDCAEPGALGQEAYDFCIDKADSRVKNYQTIATTLKEAVENHRTA